MKKLKYFIKFGVTQIIIGIFISFIFSCPTYAATDTVDIYLGYFGEDLSQYEYKGSFGINQMSNSCSSGTFYYSSIDNGGFIRYGIGNGFYLNDVLYMAGIDPGYCQSISFLAEDGYVLGERNLWGANGIFETRYCFPRLGSMMNGSASGLEDAFITPTILAYTSCMPRIYDNQDFSDDLLLEEKLTSEESLRLMMGQTSPNQVSSSDLVKYVRTIYVRYAGKNPNQEQETNKGEDISKPEETNPSESIPESEENNTGEDASKPEETNPDTNTDEQSKPKEDGKYVSKINTTKQSETDKNSSDKHENTKNSNNSKSGANDSKTKLEENKKDKSPSSLDNKSSMLVKAIPISSTRNIKDSSKGVIVNKNEDYSSQIIAIGTLILAIIFVIGGIKMFSTYRKEF